ncbi:endonuclease/exonuclease/phosphatase family protein [Actinoplanes sp. NPDC051470]|uniref:endonuclease/exonuclease/phosphatase family protein n=1 Tax=Actinoplanes sp. NPDC051470 TaxID=3157224 RepID=UPI003421023B
MLRVATFNVNNLFSRWSFAADLPRTVADAALPELHADSKEAAAGAVTMDGQSAGGDVVRIVLPDGQELTGILRTFAGRLVSGKDPKARAWVARRIAALDADVLCLQEVEDQDTLDTFCREDLAALGVDYPYRVVIEGNDPRRIDVAVCSRAPIERISSWRYFGGRVFSRDLLQVAVEAPDGKPVNVFVNHLKSNFVTDEFALSPAEVEEAHAAIQAKRTRQTEAIAAILRKQRITKRAVVLGDLNDDPAGVALSALTRHGMVEHITAATTIPGPTRTGALVEDRFAAESPTMWTHRHRANKKNSYSCFDQIWTTTDLPIAAAHVMRRTQITGDGSDHDPACIDLDL